MGMVLRPIMNASSHSNLTKFNNFYKFTEGIYYADRLPVAVQGYHPANKLLITCTQYNPKFINSSPGYGACKKMSLRHLKKRLEA